MAGRLESIARIAIAEMIQSHVKPSKYGYVMNHEEFQQLVSSLYEFFETSRNLKGAGDRLLGLAGVSGDSASSSRKNPK
jgi:hypothetical protein